MKLSKTERWILSNQYRILENVDPDSASHYSEVREAIECGYELHYDWLTQHIYDDTVSEKEAKEVIEIMDMFSALQRAHVAGVAGATKENTSFPGFDGNNETKQMAYARYYCTSGGGRFSNLNDGEFNSHMPTLDRYRRQLNAWKASVNQHQLDVEDVDRIIGAAVHPSNRAKAQQAL